jgi:hypothetical protein
MSIRCRAGELPRRFERHFADATSQLVSSTDSGVGALNVVALLDPQATAADASLQGQTEAAGGPHRAKRHV